MKCRDIEQKLSAYAEGIVPSEEKILIEEHLKSCPKCSESLADLRKTIDYVYSIEDVEPPAWLTQKVMVKIKAEAQPKKGIIQKLFYPLHIKLPLEAVVTALIAVITIYIFKAMQPEMKLVQAPSEHNTVIATSPLKVDTEETSKERILPSLDSKDAKKLLPSSSPLEKEGNEGFESQQPVPAKKPMVIDKLEEASQAPAQIAKQNEVMPSAGSVAKEEAKTEVLSRASKAKVSDEKREVVTVLVKDIELARKEIEITLTRFGAKIIKTDSFENKELLIAEIDSPKREGFIANLKSIGDIEEKEMDLKTLEGHVEIAIEIMKKP